ncbi:hypothetical protein [Granulicella sp. dw_53]|uniref:hypothetical protein n=1 Tax=Granulicella sp. dw_53 TaxID=2719792 RepID=UPI001BD6CE47|nr:hypothetical protein [Granulicella sp. dw_53]
MKIVRFLPMLLGAVTLATAAQAQTVNWTIDGNRQSVNIGGIPGRTGVGASVFGQNMYVAFTPANDPTNDGFNDQYMHILSTNGAQFTNDQRLNMINGAGISDANPSLTTSGSTLYLATNSQQSGTRGGFTDVFQSADGINFAEAPIPPISYTFTAYSPSLTTDPATGDVYLGVTNAADRTLTLCRLPANVGSWTCTNFPGHTQMGYNPALAYWNGVLYVGFTQNANSHNCDLFTSTDHGQTIQENTSLGGDQSSSNPSLAVYNNVLYYGFRSNDSGNNFIYKYSTNGVNFSGSLQTNNTKMGGSPMMVNAAGIPFNGNLLWNWNSANDSSNWLWWETAH